MRVSEAKVSAEPTQATIEACRRGERHALETVFRIQTPRLSRLLMRLVGNHADAEDLLQATLLASMDAFPRFRGDASVSTWMARIAVHLVHRHWRRPERKRRVALELVVDEPVAPIGAQPDVLADKRRQLARVHHHLSQIAPKKRLAFALHVLDGRPVDEVAALTGAGIAATRSRIYWARRALRARSQKDPLLQNLFTEDEAP